MSKSPAALNENLVVKSNELIQASYAMTVNEQRLLLACISQIDSRNKLENAAPFTLSVEQARNLFYSKGDQRHAYRDLEDASERLFERKVRITLPNNKELLTRFVQSVVFDSDNGEITLRFADDILPYLSQLERNFTQYRLQNVVQLTSNYAVRIYELIVSWTGQNQLFKEMEIVEFKELLGLEGKYKQFSQFNDKVIKLAVVQINESTDFELDISFRRSKRAYKWIQLRFNRKADAIRAEAERKETKKIAHEKYEKGKKIRVEAEQKELAEQIANARKKAFDVLLDSIPNGARYKGEHGEYFVREGDMFVCDEGGVLPATIAAKSILVGKLIEADD